MKKTILILIIFFAGICAQAQLANTKWKGMLNVEGGMEALFNFKGDTVEVFNAGTNESLETMKYTVQDSVVTFQNLFGASQCDGTTLGHYKFQINMDEMTLSLISDDCPDRSGAIGTLKLSKE